jgi:hypothetical protein
MLLLMLYHRDVGTQGKMFTLHHHILFSGTKKNDVITVCSAG